MTNYDKASIILQHGTIIGNENYPIPNLFLLGGRKRNDEDIKHIMEKCFQILVQYQNKTYLVGIELAEELDGFNEFNLKSTNGLFKPSCQNVGNFYELIEF